jgi:hypothetical protein
MEKKKTGNNNGEESKAEIIIDEKVGIDIKPDDEWEDKSVVPYLSDGVDEDDEQDDFIEPDERFLSSEIEDVKIKKRKKFEKQQIKSIRQDNRIAKWAKFKSNLKLVGDSGLYNLLNAVSAYLDYIFNFATISAIVIGICFAINFMIKENWIMSLIAIVFSIAMTFVNERIMKE